MPPGRWLYVGYSDILSLCQGVFYILTGLWPFIHLKSFLMVTGPKTDIWLVKTVAALIVSVGLSLVVSGLTGVTSGTVVLGASSALALGAVDVYYSTKGVIRKVYLIDALVEAVFIAAWLVVVANTATWRL